MKRKPQTRNLEHEETRGNKEKVQTLNSYDWEEYLKEVGFGD